jgi:hypothetical protein
LHGEQTSVRRSEYTHLNNYAFNYSFEPFFLLKVSPLIEYFILALKLNDFRLVSHIPYFIPTEQIEKGNSITPFAKKKRKGNNYGKKSKRKHPFRYSPQVAVAFVFLFGRL